MNKNQYKIREHVLINFIEWYASEEKDREPLRQAMQSYLQQELFIELEGDNFLECKGKQIKEKENE